MIQLIDVVKEYRPTNSPAVCALKKINLELPYSGMVFILGKSGSGKSTLLNVIGGLDTYEGGDLIINGVSAKAFKGKDFDDYRNGCVGFVFQEFHLLENRTVGQNVSLPLELQSRGERERSVSKALEQVGLQGYEKRKASELSGGQKQRAAIARALVKEPYIILADEPSGNLDSETGEQIFALLKELSKERLVVAVTHDRESAERYGDRIIEISDGAIVEDSVFSYSKPVGTAFRAIKKTALPFKNVLSLGISALKHKKVRLALTAVLFALTLACFLIGMTSLFFEWDKASLKAFKRIGEDVVILHQSPLKRTRIDYDATIMPWRNKEKIERYNKDFEFIPLYSRGREQWNALKELESYNSRFFYYGGYIKYAPLDARDYEKYGIRLAAGRLPENDKEIVLPIYLYQSFEAFGYNGVSVNGFADMLGKTLYMPDLNRKLTVVGIADTGLDQRYQELRSVDEEALIHSVNEELNRLNGDFQDETEPFFHSAVLVNPQFAEINLNGAFDIYNDVRFDILRYAGWTDDGIIIMEPEVASSAFLGQDLAFASRSGYAVTRLIGEGELKSGEVMVSYSFAEKYTKNNTVPVPPYEFPSLIPTPGVEDVQNKILSGMTLRISSKKSAGEGFVLYPEYTVTGYYINPDSDPFNKTEYILMQNDTLTGLGDGDKRVISMVTKLSGDAKKDLTLLDFAFNEKVDDFVFFSLTGKNGESVIRANGVSSFCKLFGLYSALALGVFSTVMMLNFISISILNKKKDIGILRAMGTRNRDIFWMFFCEAAAIALTAFAAACALGYSGMWIINNTPYMQTLIVRIFIFDFKAVLATLALAAVIAVAGCALPLIGIIRKKPVELIRNQQ